MKILKRNNVLSLTIFLAMAGSVNVCAEPLNTLEDNWYIGTAVGYSSLNPQTSTADQRVVDDKDFSAKVYTGFDITKNIGLEAFWTGLGSSKVTATAGSSTIKYSALGINGIYRLPVRIGQITPYGKLGAAKINTSSKGDIAIDQKNQFTVFGGLGAEYGLNDNLKIRAEYDYYTSDISQMSVGLKWRPKGQALNNNAKTIPEALPVFIQKPTRIAPTTVTPQRLTKPVVKTMNTSLSGGSFFTEGSTSLSPLGVRKIDDLINDLKAKRMKVYHITVIGHTDNVGSHQSNLVLSKKRAEVVAQYMAMKGISKSLMSVVGYGETQPLASNKTSKGKAMNRRVDIKVKGAYQIVTANNN